jgi:hypothetical protein
MVMNRMVGVLAAMGVVVMLAAGVGAAQDLTGKWTMKVSGGPHGDAAMSLTLKQEGEKLTGGFDPGHDDEIPMTGTMVKGALTLSSPVDDDGSRITMKANLKADGPLSGFLSSVMGDLTFVAERHKGK